MPPDAPEEVSLKVPGMPPCPSETGKTIFPNCQPSPKQLVPQHEVPDRSAYIDNSNIWIPQPHQQFQLARFLALLHCHSQSQDASPLGLSLGDVAKSCTGALEATMGRVTARQIPRRVRKKSATSRAWEPHKNCSARRAVRRSMTNSKNIGRKWPVP